MSQEVKAIKFGQLIECNMKNIYLKNHTQNMTEKLFPNRNWTRTHNHLVRKRTLNHLAKLAEIDLTKLGYMVECSFTNYVVVGSSPVAVIFMQAILV